MCWRREGLQGAVEDWRREWVNVSLATGRCFAKLCVSVCVSVSVTFGYLLVYVFLIFN